MSPQVLCREATFCDLKSAGLRAFSSVKKLYRTVKVFLYTSEDQ